MIRVQVVPPEAAMTWPMMPGPYSGFVRSFQFLGGFFISSAFQAIDQQGVWVGHSFGDTRVCGM